MKMKHHLSSILCLDINCIVGSVETFLIDLFDILERDVEVIKDLVFKCLCTHMVKVFVLMSRLEDNKSLFINGNIALNYFENVDEDTLALELFYLYLLSFLLWILEFALFFAENFRFKFVEFRIRYFFAN